MNEMLKTILDIDKEARKKLEDAEAYRRDTLAGLSSKKAEVVAEETRKVKEAAQKRSARSKSVGERNLSAVKEKNKKVLENMNSLYRKNADRWVDEIIKNVTEN